MTSKSKLKGTRIENLIVKLHQASGIRCRRVPLSGSLGGDFSGDLDIGNNYEFKGEVKSRKTGSGFKTITGWLGENNFLFLHENYKKPMIVMTWEMYETLIKEAQNKETPHEKEYRPF
jgi:hypothetical protein|tara:strand:- start:5954 stop:6307 length:354 start_codon:yes stop_codon:yes gene_type:complete